jgi:hypothetical protein
VEALIKGGGGLSSNLDDVVIEWSW